MSQSSLISPPNRIEGEDARRSTRLERSVPLIVFGQNRLGEPFVERTVSTSLNLHGCRYPSRHDYGVGSWVTLQVVGLNVEPKPPAVRARVRSVHNSQSTRELQQVGVELEAPGNIWGVVTPPADWMTAGTPMNNMASFGAAATPALEPSPFRIEEDSPEVPAEHKLAEVATFPSPSPVAAKPPAPKVAEAPKPQRVLITPDGLIAALQGKLQLAADKAVQDAVAKKVEEAVRNALTSIDDVRNSSVREIEELFPTRVEAVQLAAKQDLAGNFAQQLKEQMDLHRSQAEEMAKRLEKHASDLRAQVAAAQELLEKMSREGAPQVHAKLSDAVAEASMQFEASTARAVDRRYQLLLENTQSVTQEALLKLDARSAELQALVQTTVNSALAAFQRQADQHMNALLAESKERAISSLASLDAETRSNWESRRAAIESEVTRSAERSTDQFRKGMKAFLYSCLVAAVSAVDEHSKSTLEGLVKDKDNGKSFHDHDADSPNGGGDVILPDPDIDPLTH